MVDEELAAVVRELRLMSVQLDEHLRDALHTGTLSRRAVELSARHEGAWSRYVSLRRQRWGV